MQTYVELSNGDFVNLARIAMARFRTEHEYRWDGETDWFVHKRSGLWEPTGAVRACVELDFAGEDGETITLTGSDIGAIRTALRALALNAAVR